jgi:hypothetical protein
MIDIRQLVRCSMLFLGLLIGLFVAIQPAGAQDDTKFTGTVVSSSRSTVTVRTSDGRYELFTFAAGVRKPQTIPIGSQVQITSIGLLRNPPFARPPRLLSSRRPVAVRELRRRRLPLYLRKCVVLSVISNVRRDAIN